MTKANYQLSVVFTFAAMIATFCLCMAYLAAVAFGHPVTSLIGLAGMFALIIFGVSSSVVRMIKRRSVFEEVDR